MTKVTIHRALSELKLIDSKIAKKINDIIPLGIYQKDKLVNGLSTKEDFSKAAQSNYQSTIDLINQKQKVKTAIVSANAVTKLKVGDSEMTIADAITEKANVKLKKDLINKLKASHQHVVGALNKNNETVQTNLQRLLEATFGKDGVKAGKDDVEAVRKPFIEANEFHLHDPLKVLELISDLDAKVSAFEAEVDAALSEINAVTFIEY